MKLHPFDMKRRLIANAYRTKKYEKVKHSSKKYLAKHPNDIMVLELFARAHVSCQEWGAALPIYGQLFEIDPGYRDVCEQYARCIIYEQKWDNIPSILEVSHNALSSPYNHRALSKKLASIPDEEFIIFSDIASSFIDSIPINALHRWANIDRNYREHEVSKLDEICLKKLIGGTYLGIVLGNYINNDSSDARALIDDFVDMYGTVAVEEWIRDEFYLNPNAIRPVVNWLLELTPESSVNDLYDQLATYIPMDEFVDPGNLDTLATTVKTAHLWLVETLMLQKNSQALQKMISRNLPNTCYALEESLQRNINSGRVDDSLWLLEQLHRHPELLMINSLRRVIAKTMQFIGALELAYSFALSSLDQNPQDGVSAFVALNAAIELLDNELILQAADINLNVRNSNPSLDFASIISSCLRSEKYHLAEDLMERFRMKLDGNGHRLRVGRQFHQLNDWRGTLDKIESTPDKFRIMSHLKLMEGAAYAMLGDVEKSINCCEEITEPVEKVSARYAMFHLNNKKSQAFEEINKYIGETFDVQISGRWLDQELNYLALESEQVNQFSDGPLVSVVMTVHKWNDALPLAINSILAQSHTNIELLLIDDASPNADVKKYQPYIDDPRISYHRIDVNQGTYACRNHGINIAKGEYITFADSDDWNHPQRIEYSVNELQENDAIMTHGRYIRMNMDGGVSIDGGRPARFSLVSMLWFTEVLRDKMGGFDGRARFSADSELYERAKAILPRKKILRNDRIEVIALQHNDSLTSTEHSKIDWMGPGDERLRYVSQYRRWHQFLSKSKQHNQPTPIPDFITPQQSLDGLISEKVKTLNKLFGFEPIIEPKLPPKDAPFTFSGDEISVGMATYPGGFSTLSNTVKSLLDQSLPITRLHIHVNGQTPPPEMPPDERIKVIQGTDLTDIGKFSAINGLTGYIFTVDDDIEYPHNYVEKMVEAIELKKRRSLVGVHGAIIPTGPPLTRWSGYSHLRRTHVFETASLTNFPVNVIGTGTLAFHSDIGEIPWQEFDYHRMVDLHVAVWAQNNHVPMEIISRSRNWLFEIEGEVVDRIWQTANKDSELQWSMMAVLQRCDNWEIHRQKQAEIIVDNRKNWPNRELPPGFLLPEFTNKFSELLNPLVTIYIPLYNSRDYIESTINSALNQSYENTEICVHDDGSNDGSLQLVRTLFGDNPNIQISSSDNSGIGSASNQAIRLGKGELILQLDSDDILDPNAAESLVTQFSLNPSSVCCYGNFIRIGGDGNQIDEGWENPIYTRERLLRSMIVHHPRMFRRDAFEQLGGFDENLLNAVDYDFFLRLSLLGPMTHAREKLYSYRIHESSTSQAKTDQQDVNTIVVLTKILQKLGLESQFAPFAPNPQFPRRIQYQPMWSTRPSQNPEINALYLRNENQEPLFGQALEEKIAIELTDVELFFPQSKNLVRGFFNFMKKDENSTKIQFKALDKINLEVRQGEVLGVIGRNGSGKSTMVRTMAGIYRPDAGKVRVRGRITLLAGVSVGLNQNLTGIENVHLYGSILGHSKEIMDGMMDEIIEFSELGDFIKQPLRTYSSGMKARLGFAIASAIEPEVLLIDEVLGVGDQQFKEKSKQRILKLVESTGTVVIVSHSFGLMTEICDRIVLIHKGRVADIGDPQKVIKTYYELTN